MTIGYGMSKKSPSSYQVPKGQQVDVSFLKLFFSTEYLDLSAIIQESPFEDTHQNVPPPVREMHSLCLQCVFQLFRKREGALRSIYGDRDDDTDRDFDEDNSDLSTIQ